MATNVFTLKGLEVSDVQPSGTGALIVFEDGRRIIVPSTATDGNGVALSFANTINVAPAS